MGYGKHFESMYTGSMFGMGADVFAVWGYVISSMRVTKLEAHAELNPRLIGAVIGMSVERVVAAIAKLEEPDPQSRSESHGGSRLVAVTKKTPGPVQYLVVNGYKYRYTPDEQSKREKDRNRQRRARAKKKVEAAGEEWDPGMWKDNAAPPGTVQALDAGTATGDWEAFVSSVDAWEPDGADKVLSIQKPIVEEGL